MNIGYLIQPLVVALLSITAATEIAAALPDPGEPSFVAELAVLAAFVGAGRAKLRGRSWKKAQEEGFIYGFYGTGFAFAADDSA